MHLSSPVINSDFWSLSFEAGALDLSVVRSCLLFLPFSLIVCWTWSTCQATFALVALASHLECGDQALLDWVFDSSTQDQSAVLIFWSIAVDLPVSWNDPQECSM